MVMGPYMSAHSEENRTCRSCPESGEWLGREAAGGAFAVMRATGAQLSDVGLLNTAGLVVRGLIPGVKTGDAGVLHPAVVEQDRLASIVGTLTLNLLGQMLNTCLWYERSYPQAFFGLLVPGQAETVLARMRRDFELVGELEGLSFLFWKKAMTRAYHRDKFCVKAPPAFIATCSGHLVGQCCRRVAQSERIFGDLGRTCNVVGSVGARCVGLWCVKPPKVFPQSVGAIYAIAKDAWRSACPLHL